MNNKIVIPVWEEKYVIGIPDVDFQHKYFLELIKRYYERVTATMPQELISSHLDEIILYARFHFCSEENIMKIYDYPEYENHNRLHVELIQKLTDEINLYEIKELSGKEIVQFLVGWFLNHTVGEDLKLANFINIKCASK